MHYQLTRLCGVSVSQGEWLLMCRYLRAQAPPPDETEWALGLASHRRSSTPGVAAPPLNTVKKVAHFVSMVPFLEDWSAFMGDTGTMRAC